MAGFEEVRLLEGMYAPLQVRLELRQMFDRWLTRPDHYRRSHQRDVVVDELALVDFSQHYRLEYPGSTEDLAETWDKSVDRLADGGPTFDDLVRSRWVFFDGGRWIMQSSPRGTLSHITYPSPSTKAFLNGLGTPRLIAKSETPPPHVQELANRIMAEQWLELGIPTRDPDWLASRLWERLCPKPQPHATESSEDEMYAATLIASEDTDSSALQDAKAQDVDKAFLEWSAWCDILGSGGRCDIGWGSTEMRYCGEAAHRALQRQNLWGSWANDVMRYADVLQNTFAIPQEHLRYVSRPEKVPPQPLVLRADWLKWPEIEHLIMERFGASTVGFAFGLLCSKLERTDIGPSITILADDVLLFAADHPMALQYLLFRVEEVPALLVDMLMHSRAVCLAVKCAIEWRPKPGRNRDHNVNRDAQTKAFAVQDALSLLVYHLDKGTLDLVECASLLTWCFADTASGMRGVGDSRRSIGEQLFGMIAKADAELQSEVLKHLVAQAAYEDNLPRVRFAGVLEGLTCLSNTQDIDALPIVVLYSKFAQDMHLEWTDASSLSAKLAAQLVATAFSQDLTSRDQFLIPLDIIKLLRETPNDEIPSMRSSIAKTLREHVRLIARAIAGWSDKNVPVELSEAFLALISRSVIEHAEKGRVGALTDRYSPSRILTREVGSPALDLTAAWLRLDCNHQNAMLQLLAHSDDPVLLAGLCQHLPTAAKLHIQTRLRQLKPGEASEFWTWPELQNRIESLLAAGEYGLAREHMNEAERDIDRAPQQVRVELFNLSLRLLLREKNWTALDGVVIPSALEMSRKRQAQAYLDFYKATSQLLRENGNLAGARAVLQRLSERPDAAPAYKENVLAVAMQQLLGPTLRTLTGADKITGGGLLAEFNATVEVNEQRASNNLLANRGLLLLALEKPESAIGSVAVRRRDTRSPDLELVAVLATFEMGYRSEAMAMLDAALVEFGTDERLIELKDDLQAGLPTTSLANASVAVDPISSIRSALQQLTELPPSQIGDILGPPGRGVRGYLVRQVSRAVAALQHMSAMLRDRTNPEDEARLENDLNTAVREVLGASLSVAKWDVGDQSLGGATINGNPGERDAVIRVSGQEIAIYEALVCTTLDRKYTKQHFDKLLSYGVCDIYFHVTYSYAKKIKPLLDNVRHMLEHDILSYLSFISCEPLGPPDHETSGYIATYRVDHREVAVVFMIADLKA